ncbi:MAG: hypothetical protein GX050_02755 [Firmicutes bacterium]|nr:hypothetical protein [Bacillota bacterium]
MERKTWRLGVYLLLAGTLLASAASAAEKGTILADEFFGNYEEEQFVARGNVVVTYGNYTISGEQFVINYQNNTLSTDGLVELVDQEQERTIKGRNLVFYFEDERGKLQDFEIVEEAETGEPMIMKGERVELNGEEMKAENSSFTGCDLEKPHYHLTAERMEYYPDDRIEFYKAAYWEGKYKLIVLPKIVFSIKEQENDFDESTFGYNYSDGLFLKMVYRYALGAHQGKLLVDLLQAKGVGEGIKHYFPVGTDKNFSLSLYHLDNRQTRHHDFQMIADWQQKTGPLSYELAANYNDLGYIEQRMKGYFHLSDSKLPMSFRFEAGKEGRIPQFYLYPCYLNLSWRPNNRSLLDYSGSVYYRTNLVTDEILTKKYQNNLKFQHSWDMFSLKDFRLQVGVTQDYAYSDYYQTPYYHELPSLSLWTPDLDLGFAGYYQGRLDYLRLVEVKGEAQKVGQRTELIWQRRPLGRSLWAAGGFTLDLAYSSRGQYYQVEGGHFQRGVHSIGLTARERFTPNLTWTNTLSWVEASGGAPTKEFPRLVTNTYLYTSGGHFSSNLNFYSDHLTTALSGGYNLSKVLNPWYPVRLTTALKLDDDNYIEFYATYNPNLQEYERLYLTAQSRYHPNEESSIYLDLSYDLLEKKWDTLEVEANLKPQLTKDLRAEAEVRYSFFGDGLERAKLGLKYNWHCRDLFFGYDLTRQEYIIQFSYKVFREAGFGYGSGEQGFMWTGAETWGSQNDW